MFGFLTEILLQMLVFFTLADLSSDAAVVRVGYQKSGAFLFLRNEGLFEKALAPLGHTVEWKEFSAGPPLIEALNAGSIDLGHSGDCPVVLAQAAGVPFLYIGSTKPDPESLAIIVPKESPINNLIDLKGKTVAFDKGTSGHYLVARALNHAGLTIGDIRPAFLNPPNGRAAFQARAVDAWCIWDPFFAAAEVDSEARVLVSAKGLSPHREFYFARSNFAQKNPEMIVALLSALNEAGSRVFKDPDRTSKFLSEKTGVKLEILQRAVKRNTRYSAFPMTEEVIVEQQAIADFLFDQGIILKPVKIAEAIYHAPEPRKAALR